MERLQTRAPCLARQNRRPLRPMRSAGLVLAEPADSLKRYYFLPHKADIHSLCKTPQAENCSDRILCTVSFDFVRPGTLHFPVRHDVHQLFLLLILHAFPA